MIIETINLHSFCDAFRRQGRADSFTYEGLETLYYYLDDMSDDIGLPYELDVIELCGQYTEETPEEVRETCQVPENVEDEDLLDWLRYRTTVVGETGTGNIIYMVY